MNSYPSIYNLGHRAIRDLFTVPVDVEEKVDGSQFSFGILADPETGEFDLRCRSKGAPVYTDAPQNLFAPAVETAKRLFEQGKLTPGWTYRGEAIHRPNHNVLTYNRRPEGGIILFDINTGLEEWMSYEQKLMVAKALGLEVVPLLYRGMVESANDLRQFLDMESCLGGPKIEGMVIKPRDRMLFGPDKKLLMGKFVSEQFKEIHSKVWGENNPKQGDIIDRLGAMYGTAARWSKAIQHLKERGECEDSPRDIGKMIKEIQEDVKRECSEDIKDLLFAWAWPQISRKVVAGSPEWYKERLLVQQFEQEPTHEQ